MSFLTQAHQVFFGRPLSNSFNLPHYTMFDPVIIIFCLTIKALCNLHCNNCCHSLILIAAYILQNYVLGFAWVLWRQHGYVDDTLSNSSDHQQPAVSHWGDEAEFLLSYLAVFTVIVTFVDFRWLVYMILWLGDVLIRVPLSSISITWYWPKVDWCLTALSAQLGYIVPRPPRKLIL